jgi:glucosamine kinase
MRNKISTSDAKYFLGFDGGGTKTECVLADDQGTVLARATAGPSNLLRTGYTRAWFSLSAAADSVLGQNKLRADDIRGICAGLGGAGRSGVVKRAKTFFERSFPNAKVLVTTDLEIALEAAFGTGGGIILLAGTGSAAFGRDVNGRTARAGGRGPWISDEGSAFDIGRRAIAAIVRSEEHRGPSTALSKNLFKWHDCRNWDSLLERIAKNPDDVFPKTFPLVAKVADSGDEVAQGILSTAAVSLAELASLVSSDLGWSDREVLIGQVGGVFGRSKFFDKAIEAELKKACPRARFVTAKMSPAEAAVHIAIRQSLSKGNAA